MQMRMQIAALGYAYPINNRLITAYAYSLYKYKFFYFLYFMFVEFVMLLDLHLNHTL
jgi:hypothetical protein